MRAPSLPGILPFGVLAHEEPVYVAGEGVREGGFGSRKGADGADIGVELEGRADCEEEAPEGDVVGDVWGKIRSIFVELLNRRNRRQLNDYVIAR